MGFPLVRLVVLFGLATAACLGVVFGAYPGKGAGETTLARLLLRETRAKARQRAAEEAAKEGKKHGQSA